VTLASGQASPIGIAVDDTSVHWIAGSSLGGTERRLFSKPTIAKDA
jgi:hypothetical protein